MDIRTLPDDVSALLGPMVVQNRAQLLTLEEAPVAYLSAMENAHLQVLIVGSHWAAVRNEIERFIRPNLQDLIKSYSSNPLKVTFRSNSVIYGVQAGLLARGYNPNYVVWVG